MRNRFLSFLLASRWASVILALMYHVRFLLFVDYEDVHAKTGLAKLFYFLTGLGHESFVVFFVLDGILTGLLLPRQRPDALPRQASLLLSRLLGADTHALPPPFGAWLIQCKYLLVGASFAAVAWALYPARTQHARLRARALVTVDTPAAQAAAFTFFCHFPVMMLLVGMVSAWLDEPLMRQPVPARYGGFIVLVAACLGTTALAARAAARAIDAVTGRRRGLPA